MFDNFFRELRGRFELTQSQAVGSFVLVVVMAFVISIPIIYRNYFVKPIKNQGVQVEAEGKAGKEKHKVKRDYNRGRKEEKHPVKTLPKQKHHIEVPVLKEGEEITLPSVQASKKYTKSEKVFINLNTADTTIFKSVRGIGSFYAKRIVKYRNKLGGFVSVKQLDNVYNLPIDAKNNLLERLDTTDLKPYSFIDINNESFKSLLSHPQLNYEDVKKVVNYRDKTLFYTKNDLYKVGLDSSKINELTLYIKIVN